jgi:hypothetical protein
MTTRSSIGAGNRPRDMFAGILKPIDEARNSEKSCGGGCRAKAMSRLNHDGMAACKAGALRDAGRLLEQAIDLAQKAGVSMYEAKIRNNLGLVHLLDCRPVDARREFDTALGMVAGKLGCENKLYKVIERNLSKTLAA